MIKKIIAAVVTFCLLLTIFPTRIDATINKDKDLSEDTEATNSPKTSPIIIWTPKRPIKFVKRYILIRGCPNVLVEAPARVIGRSGDDTKTYTYYLSPNEEDSNDNKKYPTKTQSSSMTFLNTNKDSQCKLLEALVEKPTTRELRIYKTLGDIRNNGGNAEKRTATGLTIKGVDSKDASLSIRKLLESFKDENVVTIAADRYFYFFVKESFKDENVVTIAAGIVGGVIGSMVAVTAGAGFAFVAVSSLFGFMFGVTVGLAKAALSKSSAALVEKYPLKLPTDKYCIFKTLETIRNNGGNAEKNCKGDVKKTKTNTTTAKPTYEIPKDFNKEQKARLERLRELVEEAKEKKLNSKETFEFITKDYLNKAGFTAAEFKEIGKNPQEYGYDIFVYNNKDNNWNAWAKDFSNPNPSAMPQGRTTNPYWDNAEPEKEPEFRSMLDDGFLGGLETLAAKLKRQKADEKTVREAVNNYLVENPILNVRQYFYAMKKNPRRFGYKSIVFDEGHDTFVNEVMDYSKIEDKYAKEFPPSLKMSYSNRFDREEHIEKMFESYLERSGRKLCIATSSSNAELNKKLEEDVDPREVDRIKAQFAADMNILAKMLNVDEETAKDFFFGEAIERQELRYERLCKTYKERLENSIYTTWLNMSPTQRFIVKSEMGEYEFNKYDKKINDEFNEAYDFLTKYAAHQNLIKPMPIPETKEEHYERINNPTGIVSINKELRDLCVTRVKEKIGEENFSKLWSTDIAPFYYQLAKGIRDELKKIDKNPFLLEGSAAVYTKLVLKVINDTQIPYGSLKNLMKGNLYTFLIPTKNDLLRKFIHLNQDIKNFEKFIISKREEITNSETLTSDEKSLKLTILNNSYNDFKDDIDVYTFKDGLNIYTSRGRKRLLEIFANAEKTVPTSIPSSLVPTATSATTTTYEIPSPMATATASPSPSPSPYNRQEHEEFLNNPTGNPQISNSLRGLFVNRLREAIGEEAYSDKWGKIIHQAYFKTASNIKKLLDGLRGYEFKIPSSFEKFENDIIGYIDKIKINTNLKDALDENLEQELNRISVEAGERWERSVTDLKEGDTYYWQERQKIADSPTLTTDQKSKLLTKFDDFLKNELKYFWYYIPNNRAKAMDEWNYAKGIILNPPTPKPSPTATATASPLPSPTATATSKPSPSPSLKPFNQQEHDEYIINPTGYPEIDNKLRSIFVDMAKREIGEAEFEKYWNSDFKGAYFQTAKEIKDFLAKVQENPFKLPTSFEALKNGLERGLDIISKKTYLGNPKTLKYNLESFGKKLKSWEEFYDEQVRKGDEYWSNYRQKMIVDNPNYTAAQKSRILTAFDEFAKEKLNDPYDLKHTKTYNSNWIGRLVSAEREPTPTPTPTAKPTPTATP
jgi:hypothetical protein